jgi:hypothetical protein
LGVVDRWVDVGRGCGYGPAAVAASVGVVVFVVLGRGGPETLPWDGWFAFVNRDGGGDGRDDGGWLWGWRGRVGEW